MNEGFGGSRADSASTCVMHEHASRIADAFIFRADIDDRNAMPRPHRDTEVIKGRVELFAVILAGKDVQVLRRRS